MFLQTDESIEIEGITIYGSKWNGNWSQIPRNLDILVTHKPPKGHGDIIYTGESR